jgi:predicted phage-related endonuclease
MTPEEMIERRKGIGASDANKIIAGGEAWYQLFMEKTGRAEPEDLSGVWAVQLGKTTENLNLDWYERKVGRKLTSRQQIAVSAEYGYLRATLDGLDADAATVVECKHVNGFSKLPDVVARYNAQVLHQMHCAQMPHGLLGIIIGANEPVWVEVEWDEFWFNSYVDRCREFWSYVEADREPPGAPAPLAAPMPIEKMRTLDMTGNNAWSSFAVDWLENGKAAKKFEGAVKGIKGLVEADVRRAHGHGIEVTRDGRGLRIVEA